MAKVQGATEKTTYTAWLLLLAMTLPIGLSIFFMWNVYFYREGLLVAAAFSLFLTLAAAAPLKRRRARLRSLGKIAALTNSQKVWGHVVLYLVMYMWVLILFALSLLLPQFKQTDHIYTVSRVEQCRWKCSRCDYEIWVDDGPREIRSRLCADHIDPRIMVGQKLLIRGYVTDYVIYITELSKIDV